MIDPRLSWFAIGATCSAVLFGWPWHPRFSRFTRRRRYSSAAITFRATDGHRFRTIVDPFRSGPHGEIPIEYFRSAEDLMRRQRNGYIPRPKGDTPNPPPSDP